MTTLEMASMLLRACIGSLVGVACVSMLRRPVRAMFGSEVAYGLWAIVPLATVAACVSMQAAIPAMPDAATLVLRAPTAALARSSETGAAFDVVDAMLATWAVGVIAMLAGFARSQRRFLRTLGALREHEGVCIAETNPGLPAVIGVVRPLIVLPADHATRYTPEERRLLLAHECAHVARGDLIANALVAAMRCLLWCNPLLHVATRHFRHDQELACDARVVARHPNMRRTYGEAMLKAQLSAQAAPLACPAGFGHPLEERLTMLKRTRPSNRRIAGGTLLVVALAVTTAFGAWASQNATGTAPILTGDMVRIDVALSINSAPPEPIVLVSRLGEPVKMKTRYDDHAIELEGTVTRAKDGLLQFDYTLHEDDKDFGKSSLLLKPGKQGMILRGGDRVDGVLHGAQFDIVMTTADASR